MKSLFRFIISNALLPVALCSLEVFDSTQPNIRLLVNMVNAYELPRNFRSATCPLAQREDGKSMPSIKGLSDLRISGSAQFSADSLRTIIATLPTEKLILVDLRQESHGFLNDHAASWYGPLDWANFGKSPTEIEADQAYRLFSLRKCVNVMMFLDKNDTVPCYYDIEEVYTEKWLARNLSVGYKRLYVTDHARPTDQQVDEFLDFYHSLAHDSWLHFHCAAGRGRTTTFMAMVDIIENADQVSLDDIVDRQWLLGGLQLDAISEDVEDAWKKPYLIDRYKFISAFYDYIRSHSGLSWSQWLQQSHSLPPYPKVPPLKNLPLNLTPAD